MYLFTSESVTPGHPDKVCDQISDGILDAYLRTDPDAHVAVEVMATAFGFVIAGEVGSPVRVDRVAVARDVLRRIGYTAETGIDPDGAPILDRVTVQSPEIADGVAGSLEWRDTFGLNTDPYDAQGAGDQGLMFGYAVDETHDLMPLPISIAHGLARALTHARKAGTVPFLRPDGKTQVTVEYDDDGRPLAVDTILVSTQHDPSGFGVLTAAVTEHVIAPVLNVYRDFVDVTRPRIIVNPSGSFVLGGPLADTGLTGRKIIVDTYGGAARHGGGAFSGKDPSKVDRSAAYAARWVARNVVAAGLARRCEVQVAYAIGSARPVSISVDSFGTGRVPDSAIADGIRSVFDLRPAAIIDALDLKAPIYLDTATFGHLGGHLRPWEQENRTQALRAAVDATEPAQAAV